MSSLGHTRPKNLRSGRFRGAKLVHRGLLHGAGPLARKSARVVASLSAVSTEFELNVGSKPSHLGPFYTTKIAFGTPYNASIWVAKKGGGRGKVVERTLLVLGAKMAPRICLNLAQLGANLTPTWPDVTVFGLQLHPNLDFT